MITWLGLRAGGQAESEMDVAFKATIAPEVEINLGITLAQTGSALWVSGGVESPPGPNVVVFNHTNEAVIFADQGFAVRMFEASFSDKRWNEVDLGLMYEATPKILPPRLETVGPETANVLWVSWRGLQLKSGARYRIYVEGEGSSTGTSYGAYIDTRFAP